MALSPRIAGKALHGQNDNELWKTSENRHTSLHSCTFVILDEKGTEPLTDRKIKHFHEAPGWRNWQTQRTQNPPTFGSWGFDSPSRHQHQSMKSNGLRASLTGSL
jgi:hypothetical protein